MRYLSLCLVLLATGVIACGSGSSAGGDAPESGGGQSEQEFSGSCNSTKVLTYCVDYTGPSLVASDIKSTCEGQGNVYSLNRCDRGNSVGSCHYPGQFENTAIFYPPYYDRQTAQEFCTSGGTGEWQDP